MPEQLELIIDESEETPADDRAATSPKTSQLQSLPGETWADIFNEAA